MQRNNKGQFIKEGKGYNLGRKFSKQHRKNISKSRIKKGLAKGEKNPMFGKNHTQATKEKIRIAKQGKKWNGKHTKEYKKKMSERQLGKNNSFWKKGGYTKYWRKQALIRDDYTCQICGLRDPEIMEIDHIKPKSKFPELIRELNNLVALCPNCHRRKSIREKNFNH